ncbi:Uncharacterised protein [Serratia quinivorans]|nr:Uncharacterised protein [Serratia quinivorans]CAI1875956.1 Uncharacterised protein [Serratia quinivorans]
MGNGIRQGRFFIYRDIRVWLEILKGLYRIRLFKIIIRLNLTLR